ncbi:MAG: 30S ribosomal protein S12 methylthiotransferase RimO [Clostridia bacterium]|jgi:ribosomal protein S12 methylthiotransferase|nr:30S ribosomal protein S12 methylthiotransferase RimO [Clostridia bacterium]
MTQQHFKIITLGCAKNSVDSEQIQGLLKNKGFIPVDDLARAEIILLNTCGFIESAKQESIDTILELARYKTTGVCKYLIMVGCLVQKYAHELKDSLPEVDLFLGTGDILELPEMLASLNKDKPVLKVTRPENYLYDDDVKRDYSQVRSYAYVKIAEGCNNCCTYCVIPQLKGRYRSRTIESIVDEVQGLVDNGVKEIILIAQDTTYFGKDSAGRYLLPQLLRELVKIPQLRWLRIHYCYPEHITTELLQTIKDEEKICKYLDLPLQHISDPILRAMGRSMSKAQILDLIKKVRELIPNIVLRSTFIVGFPGETHEQFKELLAFLQEVKFDRAGFFAYSQEPDTPAALLPRQISMEEKQRRLEKARQLQDEILADKQAQFLNKQVEIIVDGVSLDYEGLWEGRTRGDSPEIDGVVYFIPGPKTKSGDIIKIKITHSENYALMGEIIDEFTE